MKSTQTATNSNDVLTHAPTITHKNQEPKTITHNDKNCFGTLSGKWFCNMEYVLLKFNKMYGSPANHYINHMSVSLIINRL